ncbi:N-acetyltransferase [Flavobacterium sp.]|uniref:GNAT family N-acetyltransferase n=1 Tax=Flavobacterium sp. TaxID=239 RepID=UPI0028BDAD60|nr:N-acetyltransferase [Flavobacterium sp.]
MTIKNNEFSRQFETTVDGQLLTIEYSFQEKKIFLTKVNVPEQFDDSETTADFLKQILEIAEEKKWRVVPIHPKVAAFFRKNPTYKELLPPGIKI